MNTYAITSSALIRLEDLEVSIPPIPPVRRCQPGRQALSFALHTRFKFHVVGRYPKDLAVQIDVLLLNLGITFFPRRVVRHFFGISPVYLPNKLLGSGSSMVKGLFNEPSSLTNAG